MVQRTAFPSQCALPPCHHPCYPHDGEILIFLGNSPRTCSTNGLQALTCSTLNTSSFEQSPNLPRLAPLVSVGPAPEIIFAFCRATVNAYLTCPVDLDFEDNLELTLIEIIQISQNMMEQLSTQVEQ